MDFIELPNNYYFFFSVVLTYFIFLFHSLDVKDIKKKVSGIEILFISGAIGVVFYFILKQLTLGIFLPALSVLQNAQIPLTMGYYPPSIIDNAFNIALQFVSIAFCWFFFAIIFYFFCKIIQFCLDPSNIIFPELERFKFIKNNNIRNIALFNIPIVFILLSCLVMILGYDYNFLQMIQGFIDGFQYLLLYDFFYAIYGTIGLLLSIAILFLIIRLLIKELNFLKYFFNFFIYLFTLIDTFFVNSMRAFFTYQTGIIHSNLRQDYIEKWIFKNWKFTIILLVILISSFVFLWHIQPIYFGINCYEHSEVQKVLCLPSGPFISQRLL
jgi:hypothetical protein